MSRLSLSPVVFGESGVKGRCEVEACGCKPEPDKPEWLKEVDERDGTAKESCFAFLCLRDAANEGLMGDAKEREEGEERAEAEEGKSRGGGRSDSLRDGEVDVEVDVEDVVECVLLSGKAVVPLAEDIAESPAVASEREGREESNGLSCMCVGSFVCIVD